MPRKLICTFYALTLILAFGALSAPAQQRPPNPKIRALKIQVVTKNMGLTTEQKKSFLPLYNDYSNELLEVYRAKKALKQNTNSDYVVNERQKLEEKIVAIKGKYKNDFLRIISPQQLEKMYQGEDEFKKMLIERLKKDGK